MISNEVEVEGGRRAFVTLVGLHSNRHVIEVWPPGEADEDTERYLEIQLHSGFLHSEGKTTTAWYWRCHPKHRELNEDSMSKIIQRVKDILEEARSHVRILETKNEEK